MGETLIAEVQPVDCRQLKGLPGSRHLDLSAGTKLSTLGKMGVKKMVGRLAPSPTGRLHLGHALSFLAAYGASRSVGGKLILRLDDIDSDRSQEEHVEAVISDLKWLGLDWDGAPLRESTRRSEHLRAANKLLQEGRAYPCTCTRSSLREFSQRATQEVLGAPHAGSKESRYPGLCRDRFSSIVEAEEVDGREAGLRLLVHDKALSFYDQVFGTRTSNVSDEVGDFLILRRNKAPAYQLAVVVSDALDGVTQVVRGRDLLDSTPRQILIGQSLELERPDYLHLPLVCDASGERLAKRTEGLSLAEIRHAGISPQKIVGWVAQRLGQAVSSDARPAGIFSERFDKSLIPQRDIILPENPLSLFR